MSPTPTGAATAVTPGMIISLRAAVVLMSTHRATSGLTPSFPPGVRESPGTGAGSPRPSCWRLSRPTSIARAAIKNGMIPAEQQAHDDGRIGHEDLRAWFLPPEASR